MLEMIDNFIDLWHFLDTPSICIKEKPLKLFFSWTFHNQFIIMAEIWMRNWIDLHKTHTEIFLYYFVMPAPSHDWVFNPLHSNWSWQNSIMSKLKLKG